MTFKELAKLVSTPETISEQATELFAKIRRRPFWIWQREEHETEYDRTDGSCCFNHILGLPQKQGVEKPLFDYEKLILDTLFLKEGNAKDRHLWVKKSTGLGVTELFLRLMIWLCLYDDTYQNSQMVIICGPSLGIAVSLIRRMKALFSEFTSINFDEPMTVLTLNGCRIEAFPSYHADSFRALENPSFILVDEGDFFTFSEQTTIRHVSERYIAKSDPYIVMVSTPNAPNGLFETIEREPEEDTIYRRLKLDYSYGLNKIYSQEDIEKAMKSPAFPREYGLQYLGLVGNSFKSSDVKRCTEISYNPDAYNPSLVASMGIDPSWGSSNFAIVITTWVDGIIQVVYNEEFKQPDHNDMVNLCLELIAKYNVIKVYVDGANPSFIRSLKLNMNEEPGYLEAIARYKSMHCDYTLNMKVLPVNFATDHKQLLAHMKMLISDGQLAIDKRFVLLLNALHTANDVENSLKKESMSNSDSLDACRLALSFYEYS